LHDNEKKAQALNVPKHTIKCLQGPWFGRINTIELVSPVVRRAM
jgi:hypothetical protein